MVKLKRAATTATRRSAIEDAVADVERISDELFLAQQRVRQMEQCASCRYWEHQGGDRGACRQQAPTMNEPAWPMTDASDHCGEWRLDEDLA